MKAYRRTRSIAPLTLNLGMRCKWVLNFMPRLLLPSVKDPLISTEYEARWTLTHSQTFREEKNILSLLGVEPWIILSVT